MNSNLPMTNSSPPNYQLIVIEEDQDSKNSEEFNKSLNSIGLNILFFRRLCNLGFLGLAQKPLNLTLTIISLLFTAIIKEILVYFTGKLTSEFYKVFNSLDWSGFVSLSIKSGTIFCLTALAYTTLNYFHGIIAIIMRKNITFKVQEHYFQKKVFYALHSKNLLDHPDQRITQDIEKLTTKLGKCLVTILLSPGLIVYYTTKLYYYSGWIGPLSILAYFFVSIAINKLLMPMVSKAVYWQEANEGEFRSEHLHACDNYETIAFTNGENIIGINVASTLRKLLEWQKKVINRGFFIFLNEQAYSYLGSLLSYGIIAVPIFNGEYKNLDPSEMSSMISLVAFLSMTLVYQFTVLVQQSSPLSDIIGYTTRISQFLEVLDSLHKDFDIKNSLVKFENTLNQEILAEPYKIVIDKVTLDTITGKGVFNNFSLNIRQSDHLIITGPNGSGKSSFMRLLAGLWEPRKGKVRIPPSTSETNMIAYASPLPHLIKGDLLDQLAYPEPKSSVFLNHDDVNILLDAVGLSELKDYINLNLDYSSEDWQRLLTPGMQQKLQMARILLMKPCFVVLDEATAFLDPISVNRCLSSLIRKGCTLIWISQYLPDIKVEPFSEFYGHLKFSMLGVNPELLLL